MNRGKCRKKEVEEKEKLGNKGMNCEKQRKMR